MTTSNVYITDKTNKRFFNTTCGKDYFMSEVRNMERHLKAAQANPAAYHFIDLETAKIMVDGKEFDVSQDHSDNDGLSRLTVKEEYDHLSDEEIINELFDIK